VQLEFTGDVWFWRGPSPFYFVTVPDEQSAEIEATSSFTSYGWGCIPVRAEIGATGFTTSLFPKDGGYIVPVKAAVRRAERVAEGDTVGVRLTVDVAGARGR
jgi:hypothetical protein